MKEKALIISPLGYTGLAYYDYSLCQSLAERGFDVELATSDRWLLGAYKNNFRLSKLFKGCSGDISKTAKGINYMISSLRVFLHALKGRFKVVHFQIVELPAVDVLSMLLMKLSGKRVVYTPHDIVHNKKYLLNTFLTKMLYGISDRIVVHKKANLETLVEIFGVKPEKIRIIPHGGYEYFVDGSITKKEARKALGLDENCRIALFFGNIRPGKGIEVLIDALPMVKAKVDNFKVVIAGRPCAGITEDFLKRAIEEKGVGGLVISRLGFISDKDTQLYYIASDMVALPYTEVSESGVLRYAQTCGRPVVCSDLREFQDSVINGQTGYVFKNRDAEDLARQIIHAFSDPNLDKTGENAKKLLEGHYSWKKIAALTEKLYNEPIALR
ncbi:MAG: glycosyltransferase family 4 protein [Deltaproteobacteria bacterium]|nr:glycosyltransferase family 4 protein [Deltaproteobacteria bacterium]